MQLQISCILNFIEVTCLQSNRINYPARSIALSCHYATSQDRENIIAYIIASTVTSVL